MIAVKPQPSDAERFLKDREAAPLVPERSAAEMAAAILVALNRQLEPLLVRSAKGWELDEDELDRMLKINAAAIAIQKSLQAEPGDISQATDEELRKAARGR